MGGIQSDLIFDREGIESIKAGLSSYSRTVRVGDNKDHQVTFSLDEVSKTARGGYSSMLKVEWRHGKMISEDVGCPVTGLALNREDAVLNNSFCLWYLSKGTLKFQSNLKGQYLIHEVCTVQNGGEVSIHFVPSSKKLLVTVSNPGDEQVTQELDILTTIPTKLVPYVGILNADGSMTPSSISFAILDICLEDEKDFSQHISFKKSYGVIEVSSSSLRVQRKSTQEGNGCAVLPIKMSSGKHRWTFAVHSDVGASMCVGVAHYPFKLQEAYIKDKAMRIFRHPRLMVYRSYRGLLYRDGKEMTSSLDPLQWMRGYPILLELVYDADQGKMEILKNGKKLGVAFEDLKGPLQPIVCFYAAHEKDVEFKNYRTTESLCDVLVSTSPFSSLVGVEDTDKETIFHIEDFCFDESTLHGKVELSSDKKAIFRTSAQSGTAFCFANIQCSQIGIYRFSFIIEIDQGASTCIGITSATSKDQIILTDPLYNCENFHLYRSFKGMVYNCGKEQHQRLEEFWTSGTLVEMEVNIAMDESVVSFKVNGTNQGVVFPSLQPPLTPVVGFYAEMEKRVTFLHFEFQQVQHISSGVLSQDASSSSFNDTATKLTHAPRPLLAPVVSLSDVDQHNLTCEKCENEVDTIALPCKHALLCSKHLSISLNAAPRRCSSCSMRITQIWNILRPHKPK